MSTVYALVMCFGVHCIQAPTLFQTEELCSEEVKAAAKVRASMPENSPTLHCETRRLVMGKDG